VSEVKRILLTATLLIALVGSPAARPASDCSKATTTQDMEACEAAELKRSEAILEQYLKEAARIVADHAEARDSLESAQAAWVKYRDTHCMAVYQLFSPGREAGLRMLGCKTEAIQHRTHELWDTYLRGMVTSLPEPK
jgi:uncharacterized protein YecT (DUF1311 family)